MMKLGIYHKEGLTGLMEQDFPLLSPQNNIVYVDKVGGSDASGDGTVLAPLASIGAGIARAVALAPTLIQPAIVLVGPGVYTEDVVLQPFVFVIGYTHGDFEGWGTTIDGNISAIDVSAASNRYLLQNIRINSIRTVTVDFSGKGGGTNFIYFTTCSLRAAAVNLTGPNGFVVFVGGTFNGGAWNTIGVNTLEGARHFAVTIAISGNLGGSNNFAPHGGDIGAITLTNNAICTFFAGACLEGALSVAAGCSADLLAATYTAAATFTGPGPINRRAVNGSTGALGAGAQNVAFAVPFQDTNYNVQLAQTGGAGTAMPVVTAKAVGQFSVTVPAGGGTYDYTAIHN